jgi:hypothetical protein
LLGGAALPALFARQRRTAQNRSAASTGWPVTAATVAAEAPLHHEMPLNVSCEEHA